MQSYATSILLAFANGAAAYSGLWERQSISSKISTAGFMEPEITSSANGSAICITGYVPVYASTDKNLNIIIPVSKITDQTVVTESIVEVLMAGSTFVKTAVNGTATASGTFNISASLCYPRATGINPSLVQILTHGIGFDKSYWDVAPGYSYIDAATASGYTTFSYDRLCVGLSSRPDAHVFCQAPLEIAVLHSLIQSLRNGTFAETCFKKVIGTGHSFGSVQTQAITALYPSDLDAAVLTGFTVNGTGIATFAAALGATIASAADPIRFAGLTNGFLVASGYPANQFNFFKARGFPLVNLAIAEATKQTVTLGEMLTLQAVTVPASKYTGPVNVVNGDSDWPYCMGNCTYPTDLSAAVVPALYPMASKSSTSYVAPLTGHGINLHYGAQGAFEQIQAFVKSNGF